MRDGWQAKFSVMVSGLQFRISLPLCSRQHPSAQGSSMALWTPGDEHSGDAGVLTLIKHTEQHPPDLH